MTRALLVLVMLLASSSAAAQEMNKEVCADAYDNSQVLRDDGELMLARAQLVLCQRVCPRKLADDCQSWQKDVDARLASVVLEARDAGEVRVRIDDRPAEPLPPGEVLLEPGKHRFVFERVADGRSIEQVVVLGAGDKRHRIAASFDEAKPEEPGLGGGAVTSIVLLSVGGAALVVAGALAIKGHVDRSALFDCRPYCAVEDVEAVRKTWTAAGIVAGIGGAMVAASLVVWLVTGDESEAASLTRWRF
ncbi:MAG TPA: hypothetical protein VFB62_01675 [Polyangiaceae bacterium]|nr:hypothetical protein [Polyangiaceae bacterium]